MEYGIFDTEEKKALRLPWRAYREDQLWEDARLARENGLPLKRVFAYAAEVTG